MFCLIGAMDKRDYRRPTRVSHTNKMACYRREDRAMSL